jgi:hypothetical protein
MYGRTRLRFILKQHAHRVFPPDGAVFDQDLLAPNAAPLHLTNCINQMVLESQFPHKIVNLLFTITNNNKIVDLLFTMTN